MSGGKELSAKFLIRSLTKASTHHLHIGGYIYSRHYDDM